VSVFVGHNNKELAYLLTYLINADSVPTDLDVSPPAGCYHPFPSSPFIFITQPKSWHSLYRLRAWDLTNRSQACYDYCNLRYDMTR